MKKILIINPFGIGDVLFTIPGLRNLRQAYPQARIVYIANRRTAPMLNSNPHVNQVHVYERDEFYALYQTDKLGFLRKWVDFLNTIRREQFDAVFDFSLSNSWGFLMAMCGIPRRFGFNYRGRGQMLTHKIVLRGYDNKHVVEYYLDLLDLAGVPVLDRHMELIVPASARQWVQEWLVNNGIDAQKPLIAVIPGGGASWGNAAKYKRWPAEKYQTSIMQMAALLRLCRLAIVNDGGPLHMCVAAGVPTVSIFGPVDPRVYGPYSMDEGVHQVVQKNLACQPCYRRFRMAACSHMSCLNTLDTDAVYRKVIGII